MYKALTTTSKGSRARLPILICLMYVTCSARSSFGDMIFSLDPGEVGTSYSSFWKSPAYALDEPMGVASFRIEPGTGLQFSPNAGTSWRLNANIHNHGLSMNYSVFKSLELLDASGNTLISNQGQATVTTQEGGFFITGSEVVSGISTIKLTYSPQLPEIGENATIDLTFNERSVNGIMTVTSVPEPSHLMSLLFVMLWTVSSRQHRHTFAPQRGSLPLSNAEINVG